MRGLIAELRHRNVIRVGFAYIVVGWLIAQVADLAADAFSAPEWVMQMLIILLLLGLPVSLFLAWVFELTPDGVVKAENLPPTAPKDPRAARSLNFVTIAALIVLVAWLGWDKINQTNEHPSPADVRASDRSIAVLPFSDLSPEGDQAHFSEGIAEEILNLLVAVDGLDVTSRTSSFQFRNQDIGVPKIAEQLNVRYVLEGSVRKSGSTVRITGQLIDASTDSHLWSQTFDRPLTTANLFAIQDEISKAIVTAMGETLGVGETPEVIVVTDDVDAYELYLEARPLFHDRRNLSRASSLLARAVELDPNFANAWGLRAALTALLVEYGENDVSPEETTKRAIAYAERSLELNPNSATAIATLALIRSNDENINERRDWAGIIGDLSKALELEPRNGSPLNWRGIAYLRVGRLREALADFETCAQYEPQYTPCRTNEVYALISLGRERDAMQAHWNMASYGTLRTEFAPLALFARLGRKDLFLTATNAPNFLYGWRRHEELYSAFQDLSSDHSALGDDIRRFYDERGLRSPIAFGLVTSPLGNYSFPLPEAAFWLPSLQNYRRTPRFKKMMIEAGVLDYWNKEGFPSFCRPIGATDFECD
jgi:TolB-like protein/tetratricopeptide (TPR) repeat protein